MNVQAAGELQFEMVPGAGGVRIYARCGSRIVGGLDAECHGNHVAIVAFYVVPAWRQKGIGRVLQMQFFNYLERAQGKALRRDEAAAAAR